MADSMGSNELSDAGESRSGRLGRSRRSRRWRIAAIAGVVLLLLVVGALFAGRWYGAASVAPPEYVVLVGESSLEDGTKTAGVVAVVTRTGDGFEIEPIDSAKKTAVPGTSFDRLADALPMGGAALVARLLAEDIDGAEEPAWLLLDETGWAGVLQSSGGVEVSLEESTTAFTGERLYRFDAQDLELSGAEAAALILATGSLEDKQAATAVRLSIAEQLGQAAIDDPSAVLAAIADGLGEYSGSEAELRNFLAR